MNDRHEIVALLPEQFLESVCSVDTFVGNASNGDLEMLELLRRPNRPDAVGRALHAAAASKHARVVQFLIRDCAHVSLMEAANAAMANCAPDIARAGVRDVARAKRSLEIARFLVDASRNRMESGPDGPSQSQLSCDHFSRQVVTVYHEGPNRGCHRSLAFSGMLVGILDKALENGPANWPARVMAQAATSGDLDAVRYLAEKNIGSLHVAVLAAIRGSQLDVLRWLIESTNVTRYRPVSWIAEAARTGHLHVLTYLQETVDMPSWYEVMDNAASLGHIEIVRYLHSHRTEGCKTKAMDGAAYGNHFDVVRFLYENRTEGWSERAFDKSVSRGLTGMAALLLEIAPSKCDVVNGIELAKECGFGETVSFLQDYLGRQPPIVDN